MVESEEVRDRHGKKRGKDWDRWRGWGWQKDRERKDRDGWSDRDIGED